MLIPCHLANLSLPMPIGHDTKCHHHLFLTIIHICLSCHYSHVIQPLSFRWWPGYQTTIEFNTISHTLNMHRMLVQYWNLSCPAIKGLSTLETYVYYKHPYSVQMRWSVVRTNNKCSSMSYMGSTDPQDKQVNLSSHFAQCILYKSFHQCREVGVMGGRWPISDHSNIFRLQQRANPTLLVLITYMTTKDTTMLDTCLIMICLGIIT